jgi:hypothetical protein
MYFISLQRLGILVYDKATTIWLLEWNYSLFEKNILTWKMQAYQIWPCSFLLEIVIKFEENTKFFIMSKKKNSELRFV